MMKLVLGIFLAALWTSTVQAELPDHNKVRFLGNQMVQGGQAMQMGSWIVDHKMHTVKASYSVLRDGTGANGQSVFLKGVDNKPAVVPAGALLKGGFIDVLQPPTPTSGSGTSFLSIFVQTPNKADVMDIKGHDSVVGQIPAKFSSTLPLKLTQKRNVSLIVSGQPLSFGKFNVILEYYLSDAQ